jgi:hypothetical protein
MAEEEEENALYNLAENEVVVPTKGNKLISAGWFVEDINTGKRLGYINERGFRTNYNE